MSALEDHVAEVRARLAADQQRLDAWLAFFANFDKLERSVAVGVLEALQVALPALAAGLGLPPFVLPLAQKALDAAKTRAQEGPLLPIRDRLRGG